MPKYKIIGKCKDCDLYLTTNNIKRIEIDEDHMYTYIMCGRCGFKLPFDKGGRLIDNG